MPKFDSLYGLVIQIIAGLVVAITVNRLVDLSIDLWLALLLLALAMIGLLSLARDAWRLYWGRRMQKAIDAAYRTVTPIHKPEVMNPDQPGNPDYMREQAQQAVDDLAKLLSRAKHDGHPGEIRVNDPESVREWYEFLRPRRKDNF